MKLYDIIILITAVVSAAAGLLAIFRNNPSQTHIHESANSINNIVQNNYTCNQYIQNNNSAPSQSGTTSTSDGILGLIVCILITIVIGAKLEPFLPYVLTLVVIFSIINTILLYNENKILLPAKRLWHNILFLLAPVFYVVVYRITMRQYETSLTALLASGQSALTVTVVFQSLTIIALCVAGLGIICIDVACLLTALIKWRKWHVPKTFQMVMNIWWLPLLIILLAILCMVMPMIADYLNSASVR